MQPSDREPGDTTEVEAAGPATVVDAASEAGTFGMLVAATSCCRPTSI